MLHFRNIYLVEFVIVDALVGKKVELGVECVDEVNVLEVRPQFADKLGIVRQAEGGLLLLNTPDHPPLPYNFLNIKNFVIPKQFTVMSLDDNLRLHPRSLKFVILNGVVWDYPFANFLVIPTN